MRLPEQSKNCIKPPFEQLQCTFTLYITQVDITPYIEPCFIPPAASKASQLGEQQFSSNVGIVKSLFFFGLFM